LESSKAKFALFSSSVIKLNKSDGKGTSSFLILCHAGR
jgi:hypothetical protein